MIEGMGFPIVIRDMMMASARGVDDAIPAMDDEEFRTFYERTSRPLWSYLARTTGDRSRADDLLQETYYRFYRAGTSYESEAHRRNSLFRIATNLVRDAARRARRYEEVPLDDESSPGGMPRSHGALPERQATTRTDLARAMNRLEPMQRELLWLAYAQGASHEEIAGILGVRAISVRTLLLRARRKIAGYLGGDAPKAGR